MRIGSEIFRRIINNFVINKNRIVKKVFKKFSEVDEVVKGLPVIPDEYKPLIKLVNNRPITASEYEICENSRSKSAKLRVIERI